MIWRVYSEKIIWCITWSLFGIAAGLISSRTKPDKERKLHWHITYYLVCFLFVGSVASLASIVTYMTIMTNTAWIPETKETLAHCSSALVAVALGFTTDTLTEKIGNLPGKNHG